VRQDGHLPEVLVGNYTRRCSNTIVLLKTSTGLLETCRRFK